MTPDPKPPLSIEEIECFRQYLYDRLDASLSEKVRALCDMALTTAPRPAGEGEELESVKGTLAWLRSIASRDETVRVDGKAIGRVLAAYDATLARQQSEIAEWRRKWIEADQNDKVSRDLLAVADRRAETTEAEIASLWERVEKAEGRAALYEQQNEALARADQRLLSNCQRHMEAQDARVAELEDEIGYQASAADSAIIREGRAEARVAELTRALQFGAGAAINELIAQELPAEWSPDSGIGTMLRALGCESTALDDAARQALTAAQGEDQEGDKFSLPDDDVMRLARRLCQQSCRAVICQDGCKSGYPGAGYNHFGGYIAEARKLIDDAQEPETQGSDTASADLKEALEND